MLYTASVGRFKDTIIFWHEGTYYLFAMHTPDGDEDFRNVWSATSQDGVHWEDVGPVIEDAPFMIWAMAIHRAGDRFIMNHGSFTTPGVQNVLRFWESTDLRHWTYMGEETDVTPDTRWYQPESRLDCMNVIPVHEGDGTRYYGYATGPGGFLVSEDGLHWNGMPQPVINWGTVPPPPTPEDLGTLEIGGCQQLNGKFYLVGGWFNYMGATGYGVYTLVSDNPTGPFSPDEAAYRLCGNSSRWVAMWARFSKNGAADDLVNGYMYSGYTYETGTTWLPPLKRAVVDMDGHLRLGYWQGNDALKGKPVQADFTQCRQCYPATSSADCTFTATADGVTLLAQPERNSILRTNVPSTVVLLEQQFDLDAGVVVEGTIQATHHDKFLGASSIGFYLEEQPGEGTAILLHSYGRTEIGKIALSDSLTFNAEDVIAPGCAAPAGIRPHTASSFRLLLRKNMFELYLNDMLVQTFNTTHDPACPGITPQRLGFIAQNGQGIISDLKIWRMTLNG